MQCAVVAVNLARLAKSVADAQVVWIDGLRMSADRTKTEVAHLDAVVAKRDPGHPPEFCAPRIVVGSFAAARVQRTIIPIDLTRLSRLVPDGHVVLVYDANPEVAKLDALISESDPGHVTKVFAPRIPVGPAAAARVQRTVLPKDLTRLSRLVADGHVVRNRITRPINDANPKVTNLDTPISKGNSIH